jgi:hypothetical protein
VKIPTTEELTAALQSPGMAVATTAELVELARQDKALRLLVLQADRSTYSSLQNLIERAVAVGLQLGLCVCEARQNAAVPKTVAQAAETME